MHLYFFFFYFTANVERPEAACHLAVPAAIRQYNDRMLVNKDAKASLITER